MEHLLRTVSSLDVLTVLDVGCGSGENLAALAGVGGYELTGVDISREALTRAQVRVPSARLFHLDVERESLPKQFDLVISIQVMEHIVDDMAAFKSIAKMTRAYVFISTIKGRMRASEVAIGHVRNYSDVELRRKLECVGLDVLWISSWGFPFYSPLYRSLVEWLPSGPPAGPMGSLTRAGASLLYYLYQLNLPGRGAVLSVMAKLK